jgi:hypothetical protein
MDWNFLLIVGAGLFAIILGVVAVRYFLALRLEKIERKRQREKESRDTAEANSGL